MTHYFLKYFLHLYHFYQKLNYLLVESLLWANFALVWELTFISIPVWFRIRLFLFKSILAHCVIWLWMINLQRFPVLLLLNFYIICNQNYQRFLWINITECFISFWSFSSLYPIGKVLKVLKKNRPDQYYDCDVIKVHFQYEIYSKFSFIAI